MKVKTKTGIVDLTTGQAMRLIQAGEAVAIPAAQESEPVKHEQPKPARGTKKNSSANVAGDHAGGAAASQSE